MTRSVCNSASATLELLTRDLEPGERAEFRDRSDVHMTLFVSRLRTSRRARCSPSRTPTPATSALVCDSLVTLLRGLDGSWVPLEISTPFARVVTAEAGDSARVVLRDEHRRLVKLVEVWTCDVEVNLLEQRTDAGRALTWVTCAAE